MSEVVPSIFNKADFWAMLLPGYVTVILGIIIFDPAMFEMFHSASGLPFDIFSIVVFIVAGPAVGFILWQIYFHLSSLARFSSITFNKKYEFQRAYQSLRLVCSDSEKDELSLVDGRYIFGFSTATGLALISAYALAVIILTPSPMTCKSMLFSEENMLCKDHMKGYLTILILIITSTILAVGSYNENKRSRLIVICNLIKTKRRKRTLQIDMPTTCKITYLKLQERLEKTAFNIIKDFLSTRKINKNNDPVSEDELISLLVNDVVFQGDHKMASSIIKKFKSNHVLDLNGYVNTKNFNRTQSRLLSSHHFILRRFRSFRLWIKGGKVEREIK
jgi:hypothetical protein